MNHRASLVLSLLVASAALGLVAGGCKDEDTNLPFTIPFTPDPPLVSGAVPFFFTVQDVPGAPVQVAVQYSADGGFSFHDATPVSGTAQLPAVIAQPEGANGVFYWDPLRDLGPGIYREVILRVYGQGKDLSAPADTAPFTVDLSDRLDPIAPAGPALIRPIAAPLPDGTVWLAGGLLGTTLQGTGLRYDPRTRALGPDSGLSVPRDRPGVALLRGGPVLVAGGVEAGGGLSSVVELHRIDPSSGAGRTDLAGALQAARSGPAVAGLSDGRGVILGGDTGGGASTTLVELITPTATGGALSGSFTSALAARTAATATALPDGRVLLAGGFLNGQPVLQTALLDAQGTTLTAGPTLPEARGEHAALLLPDGRVILVGGTSAPGSDSNALASAVAFDPLTNALEPLPGMQRPRRGLGAAVAGGQVVVFGGSGPSATPPRPERLELDLGQWFDVSGAPGLARGDALAVAAGPGEALVAGGGAIPEVYTPDASLTAESFDALRPVPAARADHTATALNGAQQVLLVGGTAGVTSALATSELYDQLQHTFSPRAQLITARAEHAAAATAQGAVLVVGGRNGQGVLASAELWDPQSDTWSAAGTLQVGRAGCTLTPLADGTLLVAGGVDQAGQPVGALEVWDPISRTFRAAGTLSQPRGQHDALPSFGDALLGPGADANGQSTGAAVVIPFSRQVIDVALDGPRRGAALGEMVPGAALVAGGLDSNGQVRADAVVLDARMLPFAALTPNHTLLVGRARGRAQRLSFAAQVLLLGGTGRRGSVIDQAELYTFDTFILNAGSSRLTLDRRQVKARQRFTVTALSDGRILIVGGVDERGVTIAGAELFRQ